jgi:hypothetical protein
MHRGRIVLSPSYQGWCKDKLNRINLKEDDIRAIQTGLPHITVESHNDGDKPKE